MKSTVRRIELHRRLAPVADLCVGRSTRDPQPIELTDGQTLLIIVKDGCVIEYIWDMGLPHVEFVKRRVGDLPAGVWVGTVSRIESEVVAISSRSAFMRIGSGIF